MSILSPRHGTLRRWLCCGFIVIAVCLAEARARAQDAPADPPQGPVAPLRVDAAVEGVMAKPFEGARSISDWGYGLMLSGGVHWKDLPISVGVDLVGIRWGRSTSLVDVQLGDTTAALEETRLDQTILFDSWLRLQPQTWRVRPFVEGLLGLKLLDTKYSLAFAAGDGETSTVTDQSSASSIGWGAGVDVLLANASDGTGSAVFATLGVREIGGSRASFSRVQESAGMTQAVRFDVATHSTLILLGIAIRAQRRTPE
jgi:hypothetical protein